MGRCSVAAPCCLRAPGKISRSPGIGMPPPRASLAPPSFRGDPVPTRSSPAPPINSDQTLRRLFFLLFLVRGLFAMGTSRCEKEKPTLSERTPTHAENGRSFGDPRRMRVRHPQRMATTKRSNDLRGCQRTSGQAIPSRLRRIGSCP